MSMYPVQAQAFTIYGAGASVGDISLILTSFLDITGAQLTMASFGSIGYLTLEPGSAAKEEQVSFTGITANTNGTSTLTGIKSVAFIQPFTSTSGIGKSHAGGVKVIISNTSAFYSNFANKNNDETIAGQWTFSVFPITPSNSPASATVAGVTKLSLAAASPTNPIAVGDNDPRVPTLAEAQALVGTGTPSSTNKFVTQDSIPNIDVSYPADGSPVLNSTNTYTFASLVGSVYTLTRDVFASTFTVNSGITVNSNGYVIHAVGSINNAGTIQNNGGNGGTGGINSAGTGGIGGTAGTAGPGGTLAAGTAGGVGGAGGVPANAGVTSAAGTSKNPSLGSNGASGGSGGTGSGGSGGNGGAGGTSTSENVAASYTYITKNLSAGSEVSVAQFIIKAIGATSGFALSPSSGSSGGGGGGGNTTGSAGCGGGGAGGSGGQIVLIASIINNTGTVQANGGIGGTGGAFNGGAGCGGGGAGGSGGVIVLMYNTITLGTVQALGGAGGPAGAFGTAGSSAGTAGLAGKIYQCKVSTSYSN